MKHKVGDKVILNKPDHPLYGLPFEIVKVNARHQFVIAQLQKRSGDYRKGDDLRFTGTLLNALEVVS